MSLPEYWRMTDVRYFIDPFKYRPGSEYEKETLTQFLLQDKERKQKVASQPPAERNPYVDARNNERQELEKKPSQSIQGTIFDRSDSTAQLIPEPVSIAAES